MQLNNTRQHTIIILTTIKYVAKTRGITQRLLQGYCTTSLCHKLHERTFACHRFDSLEFKKRQPRMTETDCEAKSPALYVYNRNSGNSAYKRPWIWQKYSFNYILYKHKPKIFGSSSKTSTFLSTLHVLKCPLPAYLFLMCDNQSVMCDCTSYT